MTYGLCIQCTRIFLICLALSACSLRPVRVFQEPQFNSMCNRLKSEMLRRSLVDSEGNYLSRLLPSLTQSKEYGRTLFERLSPSFRYSAQDSLMTTPKTFADSTASIKDVQIREYGFSTKQGWDTIDVDILAVADWEGDGNIDWLISCRVLTGGAPVSRTYYAVIVNPSDEGVLTARRLALYECITFDCALYPGDSHTPETPVLESLPGQRTVTTPPASGKRKDLPPVTLKSFRKIR